MQRTHFYLSCFSYVHVCHMQQGGDIKGTLDKKQLVWLKDEIKHKYPSPKHVEHQNLSINIDLLVLQQVVLISAPQYNDKELTFNTVLPGDAYKSRRIWSSIFQQWRVACSIPSHHHHQLPSNTHKLLWDMMQNSNILSHENASKNVCNMAAILLQPRSFNDNYSHLTGDQGLLDWVGQKETMKPGWWLREALSWRPF